MARVLAAPKRDERPLALSERAAFDCVRPAHLGIRPLDVDDELGNLGRELQRL
jgi:hypothetical protein